MPADVNLNIDISKKGSGDKEAAAGLELVAKAADNAGDELAQLDRKLLETRAAMVAAGRTFAETGDISPLKSLIKDERQLVSVQKAISRGADAIAKDLTNAGDQGGKGFFARFGEQVSGGFDSLSGTAPTGLIQWVAAAGVVAAPALLAAINGALLAGVGSIGIGAGIAAQARDPQIQAAYKALGHDIMADLTVATSDFKMPLLRLAQDFRADWQSVLPGLKSDWDALAPSVERFGEGVAGLATHTMPGFNAAIQASVPIINMIGDELPHIGDALSSFFQSIAAGGEGGKKALQDLIFVIEATITWTGKMIEIGGKAFDWLDKLQLLGPLVILMDHASESTGRAQKSLADYNAEGNRAHQALAGMAGEVALTTEQFGQQVAAIDRVLGATLGLDRANLGTAESLSRITAAVKDNGHELDINTAKGQANREAILGSVQANIAQYDAMIRSGAGADEAAAAYDQNTAALDKQLHKAGFTQGAIDGLIGKYRSVPANVDTDIAMHGLQAAIQGLDDTLRRLNGLPTRRDIYVTTHFSSVGTLSTSPDRVLENAATHAKGGIFAAATGAMIANSPTVLFGERQTGVEAFIPKLGIPDAQGLAYANTAASWHGGHVVADRAGWGGAGAGTTSNRTAVYNTTVNVPPNADLAAVGAATVAALKQYETYNGTGWRDT